MGWVDIHTHLLPGIDDGPREMSAALDIARRAVVDGTEIMVATPHQRDIMLGSSVQHVRNLVSELNGRLRAEEEPHRPVVRIVIGMENHIEPGLPDWVEDGRALPISDTRFILSEPPFASYPDYVDDVLSRLQDLRLVPIIAHPERNSVLQRNAKKVRRMVEDGMLIQLTAGSLLGDFGRPAQRLAEDLVRDGTAHFIASDTHRPVESRTPELSPAYDRVVELTDEQRAFELFDDNPRMLLAGREPNHDLGRSFERGAFDSGRKWWSIWSRGR